MKPVFLSILFILSQYFSYSQKRSDIEAVIEKLSGYSEAISTNPSVKKLITHGEKILPILAKKFTNSNPSCVYSKCADRFLTLGEIAVIIADRIEVMPYFLLTGMQNCTLDFCLDNPNLIEYYLEFIRFRGMISEFQKRYEEWLASEERKK